MNECIFCKIINKEIPAYTVYEDDTVIAFLDIFPSRDGQVVVTSKQHLNSKFTDISKQDLNIILSKAQDVAQIMESKLEDVERVLVVIEGMGVPHFHVKLYPAYRGEGRGEITEMGERASTEELQLIQQLFLI